ncbi:hypothetical protein [Halalkalibacter alkalisediminis]|uniref:Cbb3-type cytochrome c oxidase subunit 3 n=1 Tax=Halalkalibacter alkalisediminis TaxID=935616 RepID=A0ABV6NHF2_9BACI|nr:hypothetical protein [Halalkalibacter alkalisediminis]
MSDTIFWISTLGSLVTLGCFVWLFASIGKRILKEEKEAGRDLTYEASPFTGSAKTNKK